MSVNLFPWKKGVFAALTGTCLLWGSCAYAAIIENQPLNFGQWAVTNNTGIKFITVNPDSTFSSSPGLINIVVPPTHGIYRVDGLPPSTAINSINVSMIAPLSGGNQDFTLDTFQVIYDPVSNVSGEINITLGASAKTTGTGVPYDDAVYIGTLQLEINY